MSVVAFHYWRYGIGGAERVTYSLMKRFTEAGHTVFLLTDIEAKEDDLPLPDGVERYNLPQNRSDRDEFLQSFLVNSHVDTLIYSSWLSPFAADDMQIAHDNYVRCIYSVHSASFYYLDKTRASEYFATMARCTSIADGIACLSEVDKKFWLQFSSSVQVVSNPLDYLLDWPYARRKSNHPDTFEIFWAGRLNKEEKRFDLAIEIFAAFLKLRPISHLTMAAAGGEAEFSELSALLDDYGISKAVTIVRNESDLRTYFSRSDVYLLTSPSESFSLSLAEALWSNLPVVCFSLPNISYIHDLKSVKQVPWHDIDAAAEALVKLYDCSSEQRALLGNISHERIESYCSHDVYQDWEPLMGLEFQDSSNTAELNFRYAEGVCNALDRLAEQRDSQEQTYEKLLSETVNLRHDLDCITGSISFRLGRALTLPARKLRKLFS